MFGLFGVVVPCGFLYVILVLFRCRLRGCYRYWKCVKVVLINELIVDEMRWSGMCVKIMYINNCCLIWIIALTAVFTIFS